MEPNRGNNLPPPSFELPAQHQEAGQDRAPEQAHEQEKVAENSAGKQQQPQLTPPSQTTATQPPAVPQAPAQPTTQQASVTQDLTAQDVDLIEKSWVHRTKKVIHQTKNDPFKQKDELGRIKADYIKKRFNKAVPTEDIPPDHTNSGKANEAVAT